jgi:hypothetical protein
MFEMPQPQDQANDGNTRENPLVLPDVPLEGFINFAYVVEARYACAFMVAVRALCPSSNHIYRPPFLSLKEWLDVLRLADMWDMQTLRASAVVQLTKLFGDGHRDGALQLASGMKYNIDSWKLETLENLIGRSHPLSAADCDLVGSPLAAFIMQQRETHISKCLGLTGVTRCLGHSHPDHWCQGCQWKQAPFPIYKMPDGSIEKEACRLLGIHVTQPSAPTAPKT